MNDVTYNLTAEERLEVFGEHDPAQHAAEAQRRWGETDAYRESARRTSTYTKDDWLRIRDEGAAVDDAFVTAMEAGLPPGSAQARAAAMAHRAHISRWFYEVGPEAHQGLARMYVEDPRFMRTYDERSPGLAAYVSEAVLALHES